MVVFWSYNLFYLLLGLSDKAYCVELEYNQGLIDHYWYLLSDTISGIEVLLMLKYQFD